MTDSQSGWVDDARAPSWQAYHSRRQEIPTSLSRAYCQDQLVLRAYLLPGFFWSSDRLTA
jgi:hypothetical protein